jgi:hypothetical protein
VACALRTIELCGSLVLSRGTSGADRVSGARCRQPGRLRWSHANPEAGPTAGASESSSRRNPGAPGRPRESAVASSSGRDGNRPLRRRLGADRRDWKVVVALVRCGKVATIALGECARQAIGTVRPNRRPVLAAIEQAPAPPSAEKQGSQPGAYGAVAASQPIGLASGEYGVSLDRASRALPSAGAGICRPRRSRGSLCPRAAASEGRKRRRGTAAGVVCERAVLAVSAGRSSQASLLSPGRVASSFSDRLLAGCHFDKPNLLAAQHPRGMAFGLPPGA